MSISRDGFIEWGAGGGGTVCDDHALDQWSHPKP